MNGISASGNFKSARRGSRFLIAAALIVAPMIAAVGAPSLVADAQSWDRNGGGERYDSSSRTPAVIDGWHADTSIAERRAGNRSTRDDDISALMEAAAQAELRGQLAIAQRLFEQVIAKDPSSVEAVSARRRLGAIYRNDQAIQGSAQGTAAEAEPTVTISPLRDVERGHKQDLTEAASDGIRSADLEANSNDQGMPNPGVAREMRETSHTPPEPTATADGLVSPQPWRGRARPTSRFEQLLRADVGDRIFFGTSSAAIGSRARAVLERQAEWLARYPDLYVVVEGHSDEPGSESDNNAIARQRAETARRLLIDVGMKQDRVDIDVRGRSEPVATCESNDCRSQNRRAVIRLMLVLPARPGDRSSVNRAPVDKFPPG